VSAPAAQAIAPTGHLEWKTPAKLAYLFKPRRYKVAYGGRGGAKSWGFARALLILGFQKPLRILCAREIQKSIRDSVHKLLSDQIAAMGLEGFYNVMQTEIRGRNGTEFLFSGLSDQTSDSIKSFEGVDLCWIEEAQKVTRRSLDILTPTIRKDGSEIWVTFNPELDTDEVFVRFVLNTPANASVVEVNFSDNPWFPAVLEDERTEFLRQVAAGIRTQDDYDNIWLGKCKAAIEGAIYANEIIAARTAKRLRNVPYDPLLKVHTIWDLGWNDAMTIICAQKQASEIRIVNYIEDSHRTYDSYVKELDDLKYRWGKDYLPHDAKAANAQTGRSPREILKKLGRPVYWPCVPEIGVENGILAVRQMFPRVYFDETNAGALFNNLSRYRRRINQQTRQPESPRHDEYSHGADAFRMLAVIEPELTNDEDWDTPDLQFEQVCA
jgi:phage terminase large subunit